MTDRPGTEQQKETLAYFDAHADNWSKAAQEFGPNTTNVIKQRNDYVLRVIDQQDKTRAALDIGCGTGDLILDIAARGILGVGIDFAPEMINTAQQIAADKEVDAAEFHCCSVFEFKPGSLAYDCISANGFIEYISLDQLQDLLSLAFDALQPGGSLVLGSRNRLFNIFSMNKFTAQEIEWGTTSALIQESIALSEIKDVSELFSVEPAPVPNTEFEQTHTGIDVSSRFQYTPLQLMSLMRHAGFETMHLSPINIHGVCPKLKDRHPDIHSSVSSLLHSLEGDYFELIPQASSFMIHGKKRV